MDKQIILLSLPARRLMHGLVEDLRGASSGWEVLASTETTEIEAVLDRIEIGMGDVPFALLPRMPNLKWVQLWSAGADILQRFPEVKKLPFQLTSSTGMHGQQLTEHFFAMLFGWNRRLPDAVTAQNHGEWFTASENRLAVLNGKTMLILGYGEIGKRIAGVGMAFGMKVIGVRRNPAHVKGSAGPENVRVESSENLASLLPEADYVVNLLPATPDTHHIFGAAELRRMKNSALYINIGRGATTDEAALVAALEAKQIAGALLDVFETEPLPAASPLWKMDNVLITGHYAGMHPQYSRLAMDIALDNLARYKKGEPLKNLVDKVRGY